MQERWADFELRFEKSGARHRVRARCELTGSSPVERFHLPSPMPTLAELMARNGRRTRDLHRRTPAASAAAAGEIRQLGGALFRSAFAGSIERFFHDSVGRAEAANRRLRIWLACGETPELEVLPWELLFDTLHDRFLAHSRDTPLLRRLEISESIRPRRARQPLRLLIPVASPSDLQSVEARAELERIEAALAPLAATGSVIVEPLENATLDRLRSRLADEARPCHILHFICHGAFDRELEAGSLVFETKDGSSHPVESGRVAPLLFEHHPLRLVVINACEGARGSPRDVFSGLAQRLLRQRIPAIVAMQAKISNGAAIAFAGHFYRALGGRLRIEEAVAEGRKALFSDGEDEVEWAAPVVYMREGEEPLFEDAEAAALKPELSTPSQPDPSTPSLPIPEPPPGDTFRRPRWWWRVLAVVAIALGAAALLWLARAHPTPLQVLRPEVPECRPSPEISMKFMRLGPGTFLLGSPHGGASDERPAHHVALGPFCMGAYEVTQAQWKAVMGTESNPSAFRGDDLPVEQVSWDDVQEFLARLNARAGRPLYRLPSEAEWEYAARAGSGSAYSFGDDPGALYRYGNCLSLDHDDGFDHSAPAGSFLPNRWGLFDLYGNVSEWVADAYSSYGAAPARDPVVTAGDHRVRRGGSWKIVPKNCRSAFRNKSRPDYRSKDVGFRLARLADAAP